MGDFDDEECDDGNTIAGDGCNDLCKEESCGDGHVDADGPDNISGTSDDEECDDGNNEDADGCSATCQDQFLGCGNGVRDNISIACALASGVVMNSSNECDEHSDCSETNGYGTGYRCTQIGDSDDAPNTYCVHDDVYDVCNESAEQCDFNGSPTGCMGVDEICTDNCLCIIAECGNGIVEAYGPDGKIAETDDNEECDDGNDIDGDGCSALCKMESPLVVPASFS